MRRYLLSLLVAASLVSSLSAQKTVQVQKVNSTDDTLAYATATIRLRDQPTVTARTVAIVAQGTALRLYQCAEGWCGVSVQRNAGYALEEYLSTSPVQPVATAPTTTTGGRGYINSQGNWVPSPTRTADGQPPQGATAKCRDGTFSFSQSRRGTCSHHGGVAEWL
jgi:hypothetical protein